MNPSFIISKHLERKYQWSNFQSIPICYHVKKRILFQLINKSLAFNLVAICTKNLSFYCIIYIYIIYLTFLFITLFMK